MTCSVQCCTNKYLLKNAAATSTKITFHIFPNPERELHRYTQWVNACNNPKLLTKDSMVVYKQFRICRKHFDADCFNGACKRLLSRAVPTLHLTADKRKSDKRLRSGSSCVLIDSKIDDADKNQETITDDIDDPVNEIVMKVVGVDADYQNEIIVDRTEDNNSNEIAVPRTQLNVAPLDADFLTKCRANFYACPKNVLAQNICSRVDPFDVCLSRRSFANTQHVFAHKVDEVKPVTNQKSSGRCWIFAALNSIRVPFMKSLNIEEFEFSQGHLFYWDKIERCHYFLNNIIVTADRGEEVTGRLVSFLLSDPTCDGGQWDMITNLIKKHGVMPKKCFPESYSCEQSIRLNAILKSKLREYTKILRDLIAAQSSPEILNAKVQEQMVEIYNVVGICLGIPDETFKFEYYDKSKTYQCIGPISPVEFYENYVKKSFNVDDKVCLMNDPRPTSPYGEMYTVDCLGNVIGGRAVLYNNQPIDILMDLVVKSIKNGEPIWFGCEVSKRFAAKLGVETLEIQDFKLVFGVDIQTTLSKPDRLLYGESAMTHAMVFTGVTCDENGKATKFRVENSWGEDRGEKGFIVMSADWFREFVFEVVIDKQHVSADVLEVFQKKPIVLPAWDPMGTLAK